MRMAVLLVLAVACSGGGDLRPDYGSGILEMTFTFSGDRRVRAVDLRPALRDAGDPDAELMEMRVEIDGKSVDAILVRVPLRYDRRDPAKQQALAAVQQQLGPRVVKLAWAGDHLYLRANAAVPVDEVRTRIAAAGLEVAKADATDLLHETGEYEVVFKLGGPEVDYERAIERGLPGIDAQVLRVDTVGPKGVR